MEKRAILQDIHPSGQLITTLALVLFTTIIVILAGLLLALPFTGKSLYQLLEGMNTSDPANIPMLKYFQILSHIGLFIVPSLILAWLFGLYPLRYLYLDKAPSTRVFFLSGILIFAAVPFINYILELNMQMHLPNGFKWLEDWMRRSEEAAEQMTDAFLGVNTYSALAFNIFMIAVIPAVGEEFMFRGVLMQIFRRWTGNGHLAVWISAIIFSVIHMQFFGFFPRMILGVLFGYLVLWTGSLWPAMLAHFVNNGAAVIFYYLFHQEITNGTFENLGKGSEGLLFASISLLVTLFIMFLVQKWTQPASPRPIIVDDKPDSSLA